MVYFNLVKEDMHTLLIKQNMRDQYKGLQFQKQIISSCNQFKGRRSPHMLPDNLFQRIAMSKDRNILISSLQ